MTPTQERLLAVLNDGRPHSADELIARCLDDELVAPATLRSHVSRLRRASGLRITCRNGFFQVRNVEAEQVI